MWYLPGPNKDHFLPIFVRSQRLQWGPEDRPEHLHKCLWQPQWVVWTQGEPAHFEWWSYQAHNWLSRSINRSHKISKICRNPWFLGISRLARFSRFFDFGAENIKNYALSNQTTQNPSAKHVFLSIPWRIWSENENSLKYESKFHTPAPKWTIWNPVLYLHTLPIKYKFQCFIIEVS